MSEKDNAGVPFASDDANEQQLWKELRALPQPKPSMRLRRLFYAELAKVSRPTRVNRWLGLNGVPGFRTALGCLVVGLVMGLLLSNSRPSDRAEFSQLKQQVATLHRDLILDRIASDSASKRLLGVIAAAGVAERDPEVARALLARAVDDRVYSVRSAAIDALGSQLSTPAVGDQLMASLQNAESPLVQLALVDLVLRHGSAQQLERLLKFSELGVLYPDIAQHIRSSVRRNRA